MASKNKPAAKRVAKKKNGYEQPKHLKTGTILVDNFKKEWKIGASIGVGGFGEIYSACDASNSLKKIDDYPFVVKIEPHSNGPLFVEMHFYMRNAKKDDVDEFLKERKLKALGMPVFLGSGSQDIEDLKHRFLVMPRYGKDIAKIFQEYGHFPLHTIYRLAWQLINVLDYIHQRGYVHMDIKGANIMLGFNSDDQVYLLDFGLACHYNTKDYKVDPKKAHNGTIEYTSRDAHNGVPTQRGDIEILAYNIMEWIGLKLPWTVSKATLQKPVEVQKMKEIFMKDTEKSLKSVSTSSVPSALISFMKYVESMKHDTVPDYNKIRNIFESGLNQLKKTNIGKLEFSVPCTGTKTTSNGKLPGTSKSPVKRTAQQQTKDKSEKAPKQPKVLQSTTESSDDQVRTKRTVDRKRYVESESSEDEMIGVAPENKASNSSKAKQAENNNLKNTKSPPQKKSKEDNNKKSKKEVAGSSKGSLLLKSASGTSKKTVSLNFDLDISFDSDLIVTINRKNKKGRNAGDEMGNEKADEEGRAGYYKGKCAKNK